MNTEIFQYVNWLHSFVDQQSRTLTGLESMVKQLQEEVARLKERPPVQIGTIQYSFDQLKVETLEGTLNIGVNPADLEGISDFAVGNNDINAPVSPKHHFQRTVEIETAIQGYLETELPDIFRTAQEQLNMTVDESYFTFIKEDIKKQLSNRIAAHLKESASGERNDDPSGGIIEKIKQEIKNGVYVFLQQLPDHVKGMKSE
ncbi:spore gernimation protein [Bacillus sp. T33-2]|nr:spore gernimation protein [Bacillus sp. T33-2]